MRQNDLSQSDCRIFKSNRSLLNQIYEKAWFLACWYKFMETKSWLKIIEVVIVKNTPCLSTLVGTAWLIRENVKFSEIFWNLVVVSQPWCHQRNLFGMIWKFTEVNWEMPGWYEKHRSGWVTFKCQKALWNISLAIKQFLRTENGAQYTNYKMNNLTKNWTYPKISYNTSLWTDCTTQWCQCHQTSCHYYHTTWETNKYPLSLHILGDQNFESDLE